MKQITQNEKNKTTKNRSKFCIKLSNWLLLMKIICLFVNKHWFVEA